MNRRQIVSLLGAAAVMGPALTGAGRLSRRRRRAGQGVSASWWRPPRTIRRANSGSRRSPARSAKRVGSTWRDVVIDVVWYRGSFPVAQTLAKDLVDRGAEILVVNGTPGMDAVRALGAAASSIPIVFVVVSNPVGAGYVPNLSRPGANVTGFSTFEPEIAGKWLQLLREVAPGMQNVSMLLDPKFIGFNSLWQAVRDIAPTARHRPARRVRQLSGRDRARAGDHFASAFARPRSSARARSTPSIANVSSRIANESEIPCDLSVPLLCAGGRTAGLWLQCGRSVQARRRLCRPHPEGREGGRPAGAGAEPVRARHQSQDGKAMGLTVPQSLLIAADEMIE